MSENLFTFGTFTVNVPQNVNNANVNQNNIITQNGNYPIPTGKTGFNAFSVQVPTENDEIDNADVNEENIITENGQYNVPLDKTGFNSFAVSVPSTQTITTEVDNADVNQNNTIVQNGQFNVPNGKTGWNSFKVEVPYSSSINNYQYTKQIFNSNTTGTLPIPNGYTGLNEIEYEIQVPNQSEQIIQNNKTYNVNGKVGQSIVAVPDNGYDALKQVTFNVIAPAIQSKSVTVSSGNYIISPDSGYDYLSSINLTVNNSSGKINIYKLTNDAGETSSSDFIFNSSNMTKISSSDTSVHTLSVPSNKSNVLVCAYWNQGNSYNAPHCIVFCGLSLVHYTGYIPNVKVQNYTGKDIYVAAITDLYLKNCFVNQNNQIIGYINSPKEMSYTEFIEDSYTGEVVNFNSMYSSSGQMADCFAIFNDSLFDIYHT